MFSNALECRSGLRGLLAFLAVTTLYVNAASAQSASPIRLSRHVNTAAHEYLPCPSPEGDELYFCGMDRSGFFDFKLDFIEFPNSGGEDIFHCRLEHGLWTDARPWGQLNTNGHECVTQMVDDRTFLVAGNFPENLGFTSSEKGLETADLFQVVMKRDGTPMIRHFPEPVNSLWTEADAWSQGDVLLFVSDRPTDDNSNYHIKGWLWNDHLWGNTDVYVAFEGDFGWDNVVRLPDVINTPDPQRTPRLSPDGKTLWVSTWVEGKGLDVVEYCRTDVKNWQDWDGPFPLTHINTTMDDWGYVETANGTFWSRALPLNFEPTSPAPGGNAGAFRETNFRMGYTVTGRQTASFERKSQTDIFWLPPSTKTHLTIDDVLFKFDSSELSDAGLDILESMADWCHMNKNKSRLRVAGHTDNVGRSDYNRELSLRRAEAVATALEELGVSQSMITEGWGDTRPTANNNTPEGRQANRRVTFEFLD